MQNEVNQEGEPDYDLGTEYPWQRLGGDTGDFSIHYGTATVQLGGLANGKIAADASATATGTREWSRPTARMLRLTRPRSTFK